MDKAEIARIYTEKSAAYECLATEAKFILDTRLSSSGIKIHEISPRVKKLESLLRKTELLEVEDPFASIRDITGIRVVCLFLSDIDKIREIVGSEFNVVEIDDKVGSSEPDSFGYMSLHIIVTLKSSYSGLRYDSIKSIPFEIQVRTLAMNSWAAVSHYLDYKTDVDIPPELKKDFYALSGLFYVADKHFEMFFRARQLAVGKLAIEIENRKLDLSQKLNLDNVTAYLEHRFPKKSPVDSSTVSRLIEDLMLFGYPTLGDMNKLLDESEVVRSYEKGVQTHLTAVGLVRVSLTKASPAFAKFLDEKFRLLMAAKKAKDRGDK